MCREELEQHSNEAPISRGSPKSTIDILHVQMKDGSTQSDVDECVSKMAAESVTKMAADVEHQSSECQTDIGGVNAFYSRKSLKPFVVLEEGVTAYEHYSSDHGSYILLTEDGTQTVSVGHSTFHKATQAPDMSYNPYTNKNVLKPSLDNTDSAKTSANESASEVPKVEAVAVGKLHKATQHPDKEYADPGHPPAPSVIWPDAQLLLQQQQQQQMLLQQQLAAQQQQQLQQLQYYYVDQTSGLPLGTVAQQVDQQQLLASQQQLLAGQQQSWPYMQQYPTGYEQQ